MSPPASLNFDSIGVAEVRDVPEVPGRFLEGLEAEIFDSL